MKRLTRFLACFLATLLVVFNLQYVGVKAVEVEEIAVEAGDAATECILTFKDLGEPFGYGNIIDVDEETGAATIKFNYDSGYGEIRYNLPADFDTSKVSNVEVLVEEKVSAIGLKLFLLEDAEGYEKDQWGGAADAMVNCSAPSVNPEWQFKSFGIFSPEVTNEIKVTGIKFTYGDVANKVKQPPADEAGNITQTFKFAELEKFNNAEGELSFVEDAEAGTTTVTYAGKYKSLFVKIPDSVDVANLKEVRFDNDRVEDIAYILYTKSDFATDKEYADAAVSYGNPVIKASSIREDKNKADLGWLVVMSMLDDTYDVVFNSVTFISSAIDIGPLKTSTESILGKTYDELVRSLDQFTFLGFLTTLKQNESYVIPGIEKTNIMNTKSCGTMVPQGVCVAKKYLLISAYDSCENVKENSSYKHGSVCNSVLYVMDAKTENYITTISINTKCHVGALAYNPDEEVVYIADSKKNVVWKLPYEQIQAKAESGMDSGSLKLEYGNIATGDNKPSFLTYYQKRLYVGQFAESFWTDWSKNRMAVYKTDGTLLKKDTIDIPYKSQGVAFVDWTDGKTYMLISASFGKKNTSKLHVWRMKREKDGTLRCGEKLKSITYPNMSEDIDIQGDSLFSCYESASNFYRLGLDKDNNGKSINVVDRIMINSLGKTISTLTKSSARISSSQNVDIEESYKNSLPMSLTGNAQDCVASGTCGENLQYVLYGDGSLNITGSGDMLDYSQETAPWEEYKESITRLTVGAGVDSIGACAFTDCSNLTSFILSEFSSPDAIFTINDSAFAGCNSLTKVSLVDKEYNIAQNAFPMDVKGYVIESDAQTVVDYCTENDLEYHTHSYEMKETIAPDCGSGGYDLYACECGSEEVRNVVPVNGEHAYELVMDTEPTCAEQGVKGYQCAVCEAYYETYEKSPEHTWVKGDSQISEEGGCVYINYSCSECGETKLEKSECDHEESEILYTGDGEKAPTCTQDGVGHTECTKCQAPIKTYVIVEATGHIGDTEVKDAKEATCGEEGYTGDTYCKDCGEKTSAGKSIAMKEHTYTEPTFSWSKDGKTCDVIFMCANDATHKAAENASVTNQGTTEATCKDKGTTTYVATYTDADKKYSSEGKIYTDTKEVEDIPVDKNNHVGETEVKDAKEATCGEEGYTGDTYCKECDERTAIGTKIDKSTEHTWDSGVVIREPTTTKKGKKTYTCTICKTIRVDEIAMKEPAQNPPTDQEPVKKPLPVGEKKVSDDGKATYKVTVSDVTNGAVTYIAPTDKKLANVTIPDAVEIDGVTYKITEVEKKAFKKNKYIKSVTIGKNVKTIGKEAFNGCSKLESVKFGSNVTTISDKAFYKCTALTKISLPSKVRTIGKSAFQNCKSLKNITIKTKKLTSKTVKKNAFKGVGSKYYKKLSVKTPSKKYISKYKKLLRSKGLSNKAKVK